MNKIALPPIKGTRIEREELLTIDLSPRARDIIRALAVLSVAAALAMLVHALNAAEGVYQAGIV